MKKYVEIIITILFLIVSFTLPGCINKITESKATEINETNDWKVYNGSSFEFKYPKILSLSQQEERILLNHSIKYQHANPCDFKGDAPQLDKLTDFNVSLRVFDKNLKDTVETNESSDIIKNFFKGDTVELSPGFIDKFNIGSLTGYQITIGVEGCGMYTYYFPLTQNKTLAVTRSFISEFLPINADSQKYLSLPGIITPSQEEEFFNSILLSFKITS